LNSNGVPLKRPKYITIKELDKSKVESSGMVEHIFKFWFNDNQHIRFPFFEYIQPQLNTNATDLFFN